MKRAIGIILLIVAMAIAAGCTGEPAEPAGPGEPAEDPIIGTYGADINDNVLTFNADNTFRWETPGQDYVGVWEKISDIRYKVKYIDPGTGQEVEKMIVYDPNDRVVNFEDQPTIDYGMR